MNYDKLFHRIVYLLISLFLCAVGVSFMVKSNLGMAPWDVLYTGLADFTSFSYGDIIKISCVLWVIVAYFLGVKPSIATGLDVFFFGSFVDIALRMNTFSTHESSFLSFIFFVVGLIIFGISTGIYLNANLGAGPHLALVLGIKNKLKYKFGTIKTVLDLFILLLGILIGGMFGIGTVLNALLSGPIIEVSAEKIYLPGVPKNQPA